MNEEKKKGSSIFKKIIILLILIIISFIGHQYYQEKKNEEKVKDKLIKFDNIESEIFELDENNISVSEDVKDNLNENKLTNLTVEKLKQGGAEFIYQLLLFNQIQIEDLEKETNQLKNELVKYKAKEKIAKMTLLYVQLRDKIYQGKDYRKLLKSFELLTVDDIVLRQKIIDFKESLYGFRDYRSLEEDFSTYIPSLIALKKSERKGNVFERARFKIAKIITLRSLDEHDPYIDGSIVRIQDDLKDEDCKDAISEINSLEERYRKALIKFSEKLNSVCIFEKRDEEIMLHLEGTITVK